MTPASGDPAARVGRRTVAKGPAASGVVLHIGLHKTATRFLQRALFRRLDPAGFLVNPPALMTALRRALREPGDDSRAALAEAAAAALAEADGRTLLVSDPGISGDMFNNHAEFQANLALMRAVFPQARVLYFVRRQSDWLHSAYRQMLVKGRAAPIEVFLNFRDGAFQPRLARRINGVRTLDALGLRLLDIYCAYSDAYGPANVYLFRQEDLRTRPEAVYARLAEALGLERLPQLPRRVSGNRAFSALAIRLFFPGARRQPDLRRARLDTRPPGGPLWALGRPLRKLRTLVIRHGFDKLVYRDGDLLAAHGMRAKLDAHYASENERLDAVATAVLDRGPGWEARAAADGRAVGRGSPAPQPSPLKSS